MRTLVGLVKAAGWGAFIGGMALAWQAPEVPAPYLDMSPDPAVVGPDWTPQIARHYPGCIDADKATFLSRWVVTITRDGQTVMPLPYTDDTVAKIRATWTDEDAFNDTFTIGACRIRVTR